MENSPKKDVWENYFKETKDNPPRSLLVKSLSFVTKKDSALDLGSGALNDSIYLLDQGFNNVTAVDIEPVAKEIANTLPQNRFEYVTVNFEEFEFPENHFDLINAQYSLPFLNPDSFETVIKNIINSLKDGGIFTGQFFGNGDEWADKEKMTFLTLGRAKEILSDLELLYFEEEEKEKPTASGKMKHWHVFHIIARK